jgi:hypothetical protein
VSGSHYILTEVFHGYPHSLQANDGSVESNQELVADMQKHFGI